MNGDGYQDLHFVSGEDDVVVRAHVGGGAVRLDLTGGTVTASAEGEQLRLDGIVRPARVVRDGDRLTVLLSGANHLVRYVDPLAAPGGEAAGADRVLAPIPARVTQVLVAPGDPVAKGAKLLVLEAMKTEITLTAPKEGVVDQVRAAVGDMVPEGAELVTFAAAA